MAAITEKPLMQKLLRISAWTICILEKYLAPLALLAARLYVGMEFWRSGTTKSAEGWDHAKDFFDEVFRPEFEKNHVKHWLGMDISFPIPNAAFGAFGTTYAEIALAVLLMAGFAGRAAAFGIFMIALTIELFVYPGTDQNLYWMLLMAILVTAGPGTASVDFFIRRKLPGSGLCDTKKAA
ncbi:MAG: DoxX family membrane protein [Alphaproteobacteria bacterium]|nr:MAG: DoxX family membrane protein [Alphaproteobacteria bacterium]